MCQFVKKLDYTNSEIAFEYEKNIVRFIPKKSLFDLAEIRCKVVKFLAKLCEDLTHLSLFENLTDDAIKYSCTM